MTHAVYGMAGCLLRQAERRPEQVAFRFWGRHGYEGSPLTYGQLDCRARSIAARLDAIGKPGQRVLILCPTGPDFIAAFFGCLYAGQVAVPVPAVQAMNRQRVFSRLAWILRDSGARTLLGSGGAFGELTKSPEGLGLGEDTARCQFVDASEVQSGTEGVRHVRAEDLALLQYTSGSTADPKGVMVTHANLMANVEMIGTSLAGGIDDVRGVFWLPLFHDMGLIGAVLGNVYRGGCTTLMSPLDFLKRPVTWLKAIAETRANISGAPDFGYQKALEATTEEDRAALDLSSWVVAFSGSERVRPKTVLQFASTFAPCGFKPEALYGSYGLAEATLLVSAGPIALEELRDGMGDGNPTSRSARFASSGRVARELEVAIVDPDSGNRCMPGQVGEIWVQGPSVAYGYWGRGDLSEVTFAARLPGESGTFLRTGDLGFRSGEELFVTGRLKELIIVGGENHYPEDLEATIADCHDSIRPDGCAVFGVEGESDEAIVAAVEVEGRSALEDPTASDLCREIVQSIRASVSARHMLAVREVVILKRGQLPKTSSGKIQRRLCRDRYLRGALTPSLGQLVDGSPAKEESA
jgi:acyl-CoA synthetase (AMP-forming)/AMP-acid ligase II